MQDLVQQVQVEQRRALGDINDETVAAFRAMLLSADRLFIAGVGRTGLQMRAFAMRLMHLGLTVHVPGDVTTPAIRSGDLLVVGSGSGRTASLIQHVERAKNYAVQVVLLTAAEESPLHAQADLLLYIAASSKHHPAPDPSVLPMGTLFEHALGLLLDIVIVQLMQTLNLSSDDMMQRHANLE
jgi:6-phospho-3-hexuloisomerase